MSRLVYSSPDDGFWDTLVVLSLAEDSETVPPPDRPREPKNEPAASSAERKRRPPPPAR